MLASLVVVFQEVFEAGLIIGILASATRGIQRSGSFIAGGMGAGFAVLLGYLAGTLSEVLAERGQEIFSSGILLITVLLLGGHNLWMASHRREMAREQQGVEEAVATGDKSLIALAIVVAVAVLREGAEVVLLLYGVAASSDDGWRALLYGGVSGIGFGGAVSFVLYTGLVSIPIHRRFLVTSLLIALITAGIAGQAAAVLADIDKIPALSYQLWDTSWLLRQDGILGRPLHALIGYSDRPLGIQLVVYLIVLGSLLIGGRIIEGRAPRPNRQAT